MNPGENHAPGTPWWRHGSVWLLLAGPAVVVVASFATLAIAAYGADPIVGTDHVRPDGPAPRAATRRADVPALQGRNHAATPDGQ